MEGHSTFGGALRPVPCDGGDPLGAGNTALLDVNGDDLVNITDAIYALDFLFLGGGTAPRCADAGDINDSGDIDLSDAVALLAAFFQGGSPVPAPFPTPGPDPSQDGLGCLD